MNENDWNWMKMNENEWKWTKMNGYEWKWIDVNENERFWTVVEMRERSRVIHFHSETFMNVHKLTLWMSFIVHEKLQNPSIIKLIIYFKTIKKYYLHMKFIILTWYQKYASNGSCIRD